MPLADTLIAAHRPAAQLLAETPKTWPDPPPMSVLHAILLFGGVPFLICAAVVAFVMVPSMIRGPRYRPGQQWTAEPELIGSGQDADPAKQLPSGSGQGEGAGSGRSPGDSTGGASVKW